MQFRGAVLAAVTAGLLVTVIGGCASSPTPSPAAPTASPAPIPTPALVANCWISTRGEYRLQPVDGTQVGAAEIEDAARLVHARLAAFGLAEYEVTVDGTSAVVLLPALPEDEQQAVRNLITLSGLVTFVPIADDMSVEVGDSLPAGLTPLFGRASITDTSLVTDDNGMDAIDLTLNQAATAILADYSGANIGSRLAIVFDETIVSMPVIVARLDSGQMRISGPSGESNTIATVLLLPPLAGPLEEISVEEVERPVGCPA